MTGKPTTRQKRQLEMIDGKYLIRVRNGYMLPGTTKSITLDAVRKLETLGLLRQHNTGGRNTISITTEGRAIIRK